jgi:mRNA-degrading endonuclease RelE of RelBE toxin-antitoxin system
MVFKETSVFTRQISKLIPDDAYREFQQELIFNPTAGDLIKGSGGLRKMRWRISGRGKRGGVRLIYYWDKPTDTLFMLFIYPKSEREDLTASQLRILSKLVREELK